MALRDIFADDVTNKLSAVRVGTLWGILVISGIAIVLAWGTATCMTRAIPTGFTQPDCSGPLNNVVETLALLCSGVYALARMPAMLAGVTDAFAARRGTNVGPVTGENATVITQSPPEKGPSNGSNAA